MVKPSLDALSRKDLDVEIEALGNILIDLDGFDRNLTALVEDLKMRGVAVRIDKSELTVAIAQFSAMKSYYEAKKGAGP